MADSMAFWSVLLPSNGKEVEQEIESTNTVMSTIHLTGIALGANPSNGPHVVALQCNGTNTVLATLEAPHTRQVKLDIALDQTVKLRNLGDSEVHAYGFQVSSSVREDEEDDSDEAEEDEEEDDTDDDDYEADEDQENAKTPRHLRKALAMAADTPGSTDLMDTDDDDEESDDGEDEDEDDSEGEGESEEDEEDEDEDGIPSFEDLHSDDMVGEADEDESDEEEGEEDEEEEDEEQEAPPVKVGSKRLPPQTPQPEKAAKIAKQEPPKSAPPKQQPKPEAAKAKPEAKQQEPKQAGKQQSKQAAGTKQIPVTVDAKPQNVPVTSDAKASKAGKPGKEAKNQPQANGKVKDADGKGAEAKGKTQAGKEGKGKAAQPSPGGKGVITPASEAEFRKALVEVISGNKDGSVPLAQLGSAVKKPGDVTEKLGAYLKKHADVFEVKGEQVSLKKK